MALLQFARDYSILLMLGTFVGILAFTFWPGRGDRFKRDGHIPLQDDR